MTAPLTCLIATLGYLDLVWIYVSCNWLLQWYSYATAQCMDDEVVVCLKEWGRAQPISHYMYTRV